MVVMTEHNRIVFRELQKYMIENGVVPTQKELAKKMHSTSTKMRYHYEKFLALGYLEKVGFHRYRVKGMKYIEVEHEDH